jgi:oligosaccharide repeat unit polymerase
MLHDPVVFSCLLCALCLAMILSRRGIRTSYASPLVVFPSLYLLSLGIPSLYWALGLGGGDWLLRPAYIPAVDQYTTGLLVTFYLGYILAEYGMRVRGREKNRRGVSEKAAQSGLRDERRRALPFLLGETTCNVVVLISLVCLVAGFFVIGWEQTWEGSIVRGTGQWEPQGLRAYSLQLAQACLAMSTITAGVIRAWFPRRRLWLVPLAGSLSVAPGGSRGTLLPFVLFLVAGAAAGKKATLKKMVAVGALAVFSAIYIAQVRSQYLGFVNFAESLRHGGDLFADSPDPLNGISTLSTTTTTFWVANGIEDPAEMAALWHLLSPVPSFLSKQDVAATNLVTYLGLGGSNLGIPFPLLGETYLFFGWGGIFLGLFAGFLVGLLFEKCMRAGPDASPLALFWPTLYGTCVLAGITGLHSGSRTATRWPIWAAVWYFCFVAVVGLMRDPVLRNRDFPHLQLRRRGSTTVHGSGLRVS